MSTIEIRQLTNRIRTLDRKTRAMVEESAAIRTRIRDNFGLGTHGDATVYRTKRVRVRQHVRRGYVAVRVGGGL